jgi:hypothetical protein
MTEKDTKGIRCPACGAADVVPVLYGLPDAEAGRAAEAGRVALGGCDVTKDSPDIHCRNCGREWSTRRL